MPPKSIASRLEIIQRLLYPEIYDENEEVIGYGEPLITPEQALALLNGVTDTSRDLLPKLFLIDALEDLEKE